MTRLIGDSSEWVTIDEIGYLENSSYKYLEKLSEVYERKRVLVVLRKQELTHIQAILNRKDVTVIDLDYEFADNIIDSYIKYKKY